MSNEPFNTQRDLFGADFHRPRFHYLPPKNWMNDPNGLLQWQGQYHLFYQHNPSGPLWGNMHWGHAVSDDLVHWTDLPIALAPTPGGPDEAGCFSGCAVVNNVPTLIYTGVTGERFDIQTQCIAVSHDNMLTWAKYPDNPVLRDVPPEAGQTSDFRDPFVWKADSVWYMLVGSSTKNVGGTVFLYRSSDLVTWEYLNPAFMGDSEHYNEIWECPNLFKLGDQWVLIVSGNTGAVTGTVFYFVGSFDGFHFSPVTEGVLDYGHLYAPLTFSDDLNRLLMFGWIREARSEVFQDLAGWSGVQAIPRTLTLDDQNRLIMKPVPELEQIRGTHFHYDSGTIPTDKYLEVRGHYLDIEAIFQPNIDELCGITVSAAEDDSERTDVVFEAGSQHLMVHNVSPIAHESKIIHTRKVPHELSDGEPLKLRLLLDGSVLELIANDRTSITSRIYASSADSDRIKLIGSASQLKSLDIYEMPSIWQSSKSK